MQYRTLGSTDLIISQLGFGAFGIGGNQYGNSYGSTDDGESMRAIHRALELGCTFFDTADVYGRGHSETLIGTALRDARGFGNVVVATKGGCRLDAPGGQNFSPEHLTAAVETSLRRLRRETIDLYQLHNPSLDLLRNGTVFHVLDDLRSSGKIRYAGVSVHSIEEGLECLKHGACATIQVVHNVFSLLRPGQSIEVLLAAARTAGVGVIAREPLANGFLAGRRNIAETYERGDIRAEFNSDVRRVRLALAEVIRPRTATGPTLAQMALRFVLDDPAVATTIVGVKTVAQVEENFSAASLPSFNELYAAHFDAGASCDQALGKSR